MVREHHDLALGFAFLHDVTANFDIAELFNIKPVDGAVVEYGIIELAVPVIADVTTTSFGFVAEGHQNGFVAGQFVCFTRKIGKFLSGNFTDVVGTHFDGIQFGHSCIVLHDLKEGLRCFGCGGSNDLRRTFTDAAFLNLHDTASGRLPAVAAIASVDRHHLGIRCKDGRGHRRSH